MARTTLDPRHLPRSRRRRHRSSNASELLPSGPRFGTACGITLVELLVVIAVISILISILMPALTRVRAQAQGIQCASNLRQLAIIFHVYSVDNRGCPPMANIPFNTVPTSEWMLLIAPYLKVPATDVSLNTGLATWAPKRLRILQCSSTFNVNTLFGNCSYGPNSFFTTKRNNDEVRSTQPGWWLTAPIDGPVRLTDQRAGRRSTEFILAGESVATNQLVPSWNSLRLYNSLHGKMRNFVFLDGHVEGSKPTVQYVLYILNNGAITMGRNNNGTHGEP